MGKEAFTSLVLGNNSGAAGELSVQYLTIISTLFCFHGYLMIMRNTLQGMGYSIHAVLSNPIAWLLALVYCIIMVMHFLRQRLLSYSH